MFMYSCISIQDLEFIANRIRNLDLSMSCNVKLVKQIKLALPTCSPFGPADCIRKNSEYRLWCALRDDVLAAIKELNLE